MDDKQSRPDSASELRRQAEATVRQGGPTSRERDEAITLEETRRLLHELSVHQVELEMQNEELRRTQQELDKARAHYFDLYDMAPVGYCTLDEQGLILQANLTAATLLGVAPGALVKQPINRFIFAADQDAYHLHRKQLQQSHEPQCCELRMVKQGGTQFWAHLEGAVMRDDDAAPVLRIVFGDVTERKTAESIRESLEAQVRESQKMEAIGTLAGGIAHDLNNILAVVLGNAELARQDMNDNPRALESLEEIRKAGCRARDLVQRILSFSRRQPPERKPIALAPVVEEAVHLLRASLPAGVILDVHCEADVPVVMADATQIEQVVINLATNAMQAMQGGPGRIGIRLDAVVLDEALAERHVQLRALYAKRPGRTVRLTMNDNGMGIEAALLPRIFEPFYTTKPVDEGTGLGLSVVHGIVQAHDGVIEVESRLGKGTTFTVYLPAADIPLEAPEAGRDAALAALARDSGDMRHILYVDDDSALVFLVKRRLERGRYRVSGYTKPAEALEAIRADAAAFDLVVTDYNMPCMSGLEVAREVRTIRADLPVVVASGFIDEKLHAHADEAGVKGLIFKANTVEDLCEAIARLARTLREKSTPGQVRE